MTLFMLSSVTFNIVESSPYSRHVHGKAEVTIAIEHNQIEVNLKAPAESLLGFEHQATSEHEHKKVASMKHYLSNQQNVIHFNGGNCEAIKSIINTSNILDKKHSSHENSHAEIIANYIFKCAHEEDIASASLIIFTHYKALESVHVLWVTQQKQGSSVLHPSSREIKFK